MISARMVVSRNEFARIGAELGPNVTKAVVATAYEVEAGFKERVRVKTGNLRRSIHTIVLDAYHAIVGTDVEYAPYQEYGTRFMEGRPALIPSLELSRPRFYARLRKVFR